MKRLLVLFALAVSQTAIATVLTSPASAASAALADLTSYHVIVAETLDLTSAGDLAGAEKRITDFETAWDKATVDMRALDPASWTVIDQAADVALQALRSGTPTKEVVGPMLTALLTSLEPDSIAAAPAAAVAFSISNPDGSPVPCEVTLKELRDVTATTAPAATDKAKFDELQNKGIERCNADDDKRADGFFAEALALMGH